MEYKDTNVSSTDVDKNEHFISSQSSQDSGITDVNANIENDDKIKIQYGN